jgi:hypothetical protein
MLQKHKAILRRILEGNGYHDWYAVQRPASVNVFCFINFRIGQIAEAIIPDHWLEDDRHHSAIGELISLAIENSSPFLSEVSTDKIFSFLPASLTGDYENSPRLHIFSEKNGKKGSPKGVS